MPRQHISQGRVQPREHLPQVARAGVGRQRQFDAGRRLQIVERVRVGGQAMPGRAVADAQWQGFGTEIYLFVAAVYFAFCYAMSRYSARLHASLDEGRRG